MPAPKLSKSSLSNAVAALKEQGLTPSRVNLNPDGSFTIDIAGAATSQDVLHADSKGPKKWGAKR